MFSDCNHGVYSVYGLVTAVSHFGWDLAWVSPVLGYVRATSGMVNVQITTCDWATKASVGGATKVQTASAIDGLKPMDACKLINSIQ